MLPRNPVGIAAPAPATMPSSSIPQHHAIPLVSAPLHPISPALSVSQIRSASGGVEAHALEDDIPLQYTIDKLHSLGRYYWHKPETTDCCIRPYPPPLFPLASLTFPLDVPMDARRFSRTPNFDTLANPNPGVFTSPPLDHRRGSEPVSADVPTLMKLHVRVIPSHSV
jgi:hypothetical protein